MKLYMKAEKIEKELLPLEGVSHFGAIFKKKII